MVSGRGEYHQVEEARDLTALRRNGEGPLDPSDHLVEKPAITQPISISVRKKRLLLVDDVADTGQSLELVNKYLKEEGALEIKGSRPTNMSGGALGVGNCLEATGLQKSLEIVTQLRGHAAKRQVPDAECGIAQSWRFLPTGSGAIAIFERG